MTEPILGILLLFLVLILTIYFFGFRNTSEQHKDAVKANTSLSSTSRPIVKTSNTNLPVVVIAGPSGSGKTSLLHALIFGRAPPTISSARVTALTLPLFNRTSVFSWKEFPDGIRGPFLTAAASARVLLIVIDAAGDAVHIANAGRLIYTIFTQEKVVVSGAKMLIVAARADIVGSRSPSVLRAALSIELDRLRESNAVVSMVASAKDEKTVSLGGGGRAGLPFDFETDSPLKTEFCSASLKQLNNITEFLIATCET